MKYIPSCVSYIFIIYLWFWLIFAESGFVLNIYQNIFFLPLFPDVNITTPYFALDSYMSFQQPASLAVWSKFLMHVRFRPDSSDGLLFYAGHTKDNVATGDFLSVSIWRRWDEFVFVLSFNSLFRFKNVEMHNVVFSLTQYRTSRLRLYDDMILSRVMKLLNTFYKNKQIWFLFRYVYVKFNLGTHTASMRTRDKITIRQWHSLYVRRENKEAVMRLDDGPYIGVRASGPMSKLDVSTDFFLGGVATLASLNPASLKDVTSQRDFNGCFSSFEVMHFFFWFCFRFVLCLVLRNKDVRIVRNFSPPQIFKICNFGLSI